MSSGGNDPRRTMLRRRKRRCSATRAGSEPGRRWTSTRIPSAPTPNLRRLLGREVRVVFAEAFDEAVEGDVVGGDRLRLVTLADDDRVGCLGAGADRRPDRLPAVFVDQAPELL